MDFLMKIESLLKYIGLQIRAILAPDAVTAPKITFCMAFQLLLLCLREEL